MSSGCLKVFIGFLVIVAIITCIVVGIGHVEKRNAADEMAKYEMTVKNLTMTVVDKTEGTKKSSYSDGYVSAFKIIFKNNGVHEIQGLEGDMKAYNAAGELLISTTCTFTGSIPVGEESKFTLNIDHRYSEEVLEFYYADYEDLRVTFKVTAATFEDGTYVELEQDAVTILELSTNADGVSSTEKAYREAISLYNREAYADALSLFEKLGYYKDSNEYCQQCREKVELATREEKYDTVLSLVEQERFAEAIAMLDETADSELIEEIYGLAEGVAGALAYEGKYAEACAVLEPLGYTTKNDQAYRAYYYASQGDFATAVKSGLTVVVFPEGTVSIPNRYFKSSYGDSCLEQVVLPSTLKNIGDEAFYGCARLTEIQLPRGLETIGASAFYACRRLSEIELPSTVISLAESTFEGCAELKSVTLPDRGLLTIGKSAFRGTGVGEIIFPETLQTIGDYAFAGCSSLRNITLPESLLVLGESAFSGCTILSSVSIPGSVKNVGDCAFMDCERLTQVILGEGVEVIGGAAFSSCNMLVTVTLPLSLKKLLGGAFSDCMMLAQIIIPSNVTEIRGGAFSGCVALKNVYFSNTEGWKDGYGQAVDVNDAAKNASKLTYYHDTSWRREEA